MNTADKLDYIKQYLKSVHAIWALQRALACDVPVDDTCVTGLYVNASDCIIINSPKGFSTLTLCDGELIVKIFDYLHNTYPNFRKLNRI